MQKVADIKHAGGAGRRGVGAGLDAAAAVNDAAEGPDRGKRERLRGFQRRITNERTEEEREGGRGGRDGGDAAIGIPPPSTATKKENKIAV